MTNEDREYYAGEDFKEVPDETEEPRLLQRVNFPRKGSAQRLMNFIINGDVNNTNHLSKIHD